MHTLSIREQIRALQNKQISSTELTKHYLKRINNASNLNAFIHVDEEQALLAAQRADATIQSGHAKPLTGIPFAHKDNICTTKEPTTCGSKMLANFISPFAATIAERLEREFAVLLGKTSLDEFAMGSTNTTSFYGHVKNPWSLSHVPGGSSGGSAACVAADLAAFATGTDTGGSIRQPASFCGISSLKPTYGLVSRWGLVSFASSLDQIGPMARSAEDLAFVLQAMAGFDEKDSTSSQKPVPNYLAHINKPLSPLTIGFPSQWMDSVHPAVRQSTLAAIELLKKEGANIVPIHLSLASLWSPCYYVIASVEAASNLSRYDGIRFGHRTSQANTVQELINRSRSEGFGIEVKRRILAGTHFSSSAHFNEYYVQAQKVRRMIQREVLDCFSAVDVILTPTTPTPAFSIQDNLYDPSEAHASDRFTTVANLGGFPALSIPSGLDQSLPIGMQLIGPHFSEARLLNIAHLYQKLTQWHLQRPYNTRGAV